jgi:dTDP-4-dehydrorhamnose reductase
MRAVIVGAGGQLGQELARRLPEATALDRAALDVTDAAAVRSHLEAARPDVVFNASSYNRVDAAESDPAPAFAVNAHAVRELAVLCRDLGARLVHFSTNYAFGRDLARRRPYLETERPEPPNAYGASKVIGEEFVGMICPRALVIRTAALFGRARGTRSNFLENMRTRAAAGDSLQIVADQVVAPTATADLAVAALHLVEKDAIGVYHLNGPDGTSWYELARFFLEKAGLADRIRPVTTEELGAPAPRPRYSVLAIDKYLATGGPAPTPWREAVERYRSTEARE